MIHIGNVVIVTIDHIILSTIFIYIGYTKKRQSIFMIQVTSQCIIHTNGL